MIFDDVILTAPEAQRSFLREQILRSSVYLNVQGVYEPSILSTDLFPGSRNVVAYRIDAKRAILVRNSIQAVTMQHQPLQNVISTEEFLFDEECREFVEWVSIAENVAVVVSPLLQVELDGTTYSRAVLTRGYLGEGCLRTLKEEMSDLSKFWFVYTIGRRSSVWLGGNVLRTEVRLVDTPLPRWLSLSISRRRKVSKLTGEDRLLRYIGQIPSTKPEEEGGHCLSDRKLRGGTGLQDRVHVQGSEDSTRRTPTYEPLSAEGYVHIPDILRTTPGKNPTSNLFPGDHSSRVVSDDTIGRILFPGDLPEIRSQLHPFREGEHHIFEEAEVTLKKTPQTL